MTILLILLAVIAVLGLWAVGVYNNLVKLRNNRENAFANIDVQLKQRHDLVGQLVAVVKGYAEHEKEVLTRVTEARSAAMNASTIGDKIQAENALTSALSGLKISLEAYPDLKANQNFLQLQTEIAEQTGCRSPLLQHCYARAQQCRSDIPVEYLRRPVRFPQGANVRGFHRGACQPRQSTGDKL